MTTTNAMDDVRAQLHRHFGHNEFREGQEQIVAAVLGGRDVLAVMPTGSGKSLGYQLPAVMLPGTTLVVSPLISLMKDQMDELNRRGIPSRALHSMLSADSKREVLAAGRCGRLRLLYVAPERFASDHFLQFLAELDVARFVVDEAHCVSEWGHDFRPDYRRLRIAAALCRQRDVNGVGRPPIAAFTATATPEVRADIIELLGLDEPRVLVAGFDRPNIHLRVERVDNDEEKDDLLPGLVRGRRALVYAATRKTAAAAATLLQGCGVNAAAYHAGLKDHERTRVQDAFAAGSLPVVCATNAFGMGIDRPDVDAVVHYAIPGSVEAYYQEIGRAGRDGRPATATLLWDYGDVATRQFLIDSPRRDKPGHAAGVNDEEVARRKALEHAKLQRMIEYAESPECLRATILRYFGDPAARDRCDACGNCRPGAIDAYERGLVRTILSGIRYAGERYGRYRITAMLKGDIPNLPQALTMLSTTGSLQHETEDAISAWIDASIAAGLIVVSKEYRTLKLTEQGWDVIHGRNQHPQIRRPTRMPARYTSTRSRRELLHEMREELSLQGRRSWRFDE